MCEKNLNPTQTQTEVMNIRRKKKQGKRKIPQKTKK
jgi:hypothetical protein